MITRPTSTSHISPATNHNLPPSVRGRLYPGTRFIGPSAFFTLEDARKLAESILAIVSDSTSADPMVRLKFNRPARADLACATYPTAVKVLRHRKPS